MTRPSRDKLNFRYSVCSHGLYMSEHVRSYTYAPSRTSGWIVSATLGCKASCRTKGSWRT